MLSSARVRDGYFGVYLFVLYGSERERSEISLAFNFDIMKLF